MNLVGAAILICTTLPLAGQVLHKSQYRKVIVPPGMAFRVTADTISIDTLVLEDDAALLFEKSATMVVVEHAYVGEACRLDASGRGKNGMDGENGKDLTVAIRLHALGSLTLTTRGEDGAPGASVPRGRTGKGGQGGHGGNAGDLTFYYACEGFTPVFNQKDRMHSIFLDLSGGTGGQGGSGQREQSRATPGSFGAPMSSSTAMAAMKGPWGPDGKDGTLIFEKLN